MLLEKMNWMDVENYTKQDSRIVFVLGATEQHGYLSLLTDTLSPFEIARRACELEKVILAPALPFGFSHWALDYPGTLSLSTTAYDQVIKDLMASALRAKLSHVLLLNGHSGNRGARESAIEAIVDHPEARVWFYSWWELPKTAAFIKANGGITHANWAENFPFTRVGGVPDKDAPASERPFRQSASRWREAFPDGVMGGKYQLDDKITQQLLDIAVEETRAILHQMADA